MAQSNQTEPGTARRREKAREQGQVARARDLPGALAMLAAIAAMSWLMRGGLTRWQMQFRLLLEQATRPEAQIGIDQLRGAFTQALYWTGPVVGCAWLAGALAGFQGGFVFAAPALFKMERLIPGQQLKSLFSAAGFSRMARSIVPVAAIGWLAFAMLSANWNQLLRSGAMAPTQSLGWTAGLLSSLCWKAALILLAWAGVDYLLQRQSYESSLRMSKQEIKDEGKETQGNPEVRGRIRKLQRQMRRKRMLLDVPKATVVITNPTEFAVALRYEAGVMAAPVVVAKGRLLLAQAIRQTAVWSGVPVVENVALARGLYRNVEIGEAIPGDFYAAVAEILAFVFRASGRRAAAGAGGR